VAHRDCQTFPLTTGFLYAQDPFKGVFTGKAKVIPLQTWIGPEGFRRLRLPDFKTIGI